MHLGSLAGHEIGLNLPYAISLCCINTGVYTYTASDIFTKIQCNNSEFICLFCVLCKDRKRVECFMEISRVYRLFWIRDIFFHWFQKITCQIDLQFFVQKKRLDWCKVQLFWENQKNSAQSSSKFWRYLVMSKPWGRLCQIFVSGLLRKVELYQ